MAQQDDYYYEIQLTNKQLVFYFLAGATGLIFSFLAGVMVGRGVDNNMNAAEAAARPVQEERIVPEEPAKPSSAPPEELTYAQRLEGEKSDDSLEKAGKGATSAVPKPAASGDAKTTEKPAEKAAAPKPPVADKASPATKATPVPKAPAKAVPASKPAAGTFNIQVGAFKDKDTAESVVARLKKKGFTAFVVAPEGSDNLFNVRVGSFAARADAERAQTKLRDEEKFKPFIVKN